MKFLHVSILCLLIISCGQSPEVEESITEETSAEIQLNIDWLPFDQTAFDLAKEENKLVFLEVGANWCHWCHVMDEKTYADQEVEEYLKANFILCREDQDSRPDLYAAYKKYGWPAIIAFDTEKNEVMRLKGYQEKNKFLNILKETVENPVPLEDESGIASEINESDEALKSKFLSRLDHKLGMYNWNNKYLPLEGIIHGVRYYDQSDSLAKWTDLTVKNSYELVDPVWGGAYQYSAKKSWNNQHYEKLLRVQASYIEAYSIYSLLNNNPKSLKKAEEIVSYCDRFLYSTEKGLYFNSQNADVIVGQESDEYYAKNEDERLEIGTPSVDESIYLKENAMMAKALTHFYFASESEQLRSKAFSLTESILVNFVTFKGVYSRNETGNTSLAFEDNRRLIELLMFQHQFLGVEEYLEYAVKLGDHVIREFDSEDGMRATRGNSPIQSPIVQLDNLNAVLTFNFLGHLSGNERFVNHAIELYEKLDQQELIMKVGYIPLLLRAQQELRAEPYHAVLIADDKTDDLPFKKWVLSTANQYIIFETATIGSFTEEQELMYGGIDAGTMFMCTSSFCSAPIKTYSEFLEFVNGI